MNVTMARKEHSKLSKNSVYLIMEKKRIVLEDANFDPCILLGSLNYGSFFLLLACSPALVGACSVC